MSELPIETGGDGVQPAPRKLGHRQLDLVLALSAIFISAVSLVVAIEHGRTQRELVAAGTWPFLQRVLNYQTGSSFKVAIGVSNNGVGPAKVRSIELLLDGKPMSSTRELLTKCCGYHGAPGEHPRGLTLSEADNTVLRAGEENEMLRFGAAAENSELSRRLSAAVPRLTFRGCYCSVLDECFTGDLASVNVAKVSSCPMPAHRFDPFKF